MKLTGKIATTCAMMCVSLSSLAADFANVEQWLKQAKAAAKLQSGTAIAVVKGDEIIYEGYFGYADIAAKKKVDANTSFYIASVTKPYFSLSMLMQEHQGKLSESTNMATMFPNTKFSGFEPEKVTVKHLLTHTMGIDNDPLVMRTAYSGEHDLNVRGQLVQASYLNEESPLGIFDYSNVGYNILSVWVDNTGPHNWQDLMQQSVFEPLQSQRTSAYISTASNNNWDLAKPYSFRAGNDAPLYLSKQDNTMHSAGGMISSARDMANFLKVQLNDGELDGKQVFPASVIQKSQQQVASTDGNFGDFKRTGYAWGWFIGPYMEETLYHHFGGYSGAHTHLSFMPEKNIGVVILNNEDTVSYETTRFVARGIYAALLDKQSHTDEAGQKATDLLGKIDSFSKRISEQRKELAEREWQLTLEKSEYVGEYVHKDYGKVRIAQTEGEDLIISWGQLRTKATAFTKPDTMRVELIPNRGEVLNFQKHGEKVSGFTYQGNKFQKL